SSGDHGANTGLTGAFAGPLYPSVSPLVVAVGGTTLNVTGTTRTSETGWSYGSDSFCPSCASGGGISSTYSQPPWQQGVQSTGFRAAPDVSSDADPATGVSVNDPFDGGWFVVGGTSLSSPTWAGFIAIANQGHQILTGTNMNGPNQVLPGLYQLLDYTSNY